MRSRLVLLPWLLLYVALLVKRFEANISRETSLHTSAAFIPDVEGASDGDWWDVTAQAPLVESRPPKVACELLCSNMTPEEVAMLATFRRVFHTYLFSVVGLTAAVANGLNLVILFRQRQALSPFTYMTAIAACDLVSGLCLMYLAVSWSRQLQYLSHGVRLLSYHGGLLVFALNEACATAAGLLAMTLGIDRLIAIRYPLKRTAMCRVKMARIASTLIIIFGTLINIPTVFRVKMVWFTESLGPDYPVLDYTSFGKHPDVNNTARSLALIFRFVVPFASMIITSSLTLHALHQSHKFRRSAAASTNHKSEEMSSLSLQCVTITVGVTVAFFFTQMPRSAYYVDSMLFGNAHRGYFAFEIFMYVNEILSWSNTNVNFFIYAALSKSFRKDMRSMCACLRTVREAHSGTDAYCMSSLQTPSIATIETTSISARI